MLLHSTTTITQRLDCYRHVSIDTTRVRIEHSDAVWMLQHQDGSVNPICCLKIGAASWSSFELERA